MYSSRGVLGPFTGLARLAASAPCPLVAIPRTTRPNAGNQPVQRFMCNLSRMKISEQTLPVHDPVYKQSIYPNRSGAVFNPLGRRGPATLFSSGTRVFNQNAFTAVRPNYAKRGKQPD